MIIWIVFGSSMRIPLVPQYEHTSQNVNLVKLTIASGSITQFSGSVVVVFW